MLKKRLSAAVIIKDGWVVQSRKFNEYLPIGRAENVVKNLDDWGADEIIILSISSYQNNCPDFELVEKFSQIGIRTPLIYGGGIKSYKDAIKIIKLGADKIILNQAFISNKLEIKKICNTIGKESMVLSINFIKKNNIFYFYDYYKKKKLSFNEKEINYFYENFFSEILVSDTDNEGVVNGFDFKILQESFLKGKKIMVYGGINKIKQFRRLFRYSCISSVVVGNFINFKESGIFNIKKKCKYGFRR